MSTLEAVTVRGKYVHESITHVVIDCADDTYRIPKKYILELSAAGELLSMAVLRSVCDRLGVDYSEEDIQEISM